MNLNDCLKEEVIAQSINRFYPMNFKTLKRNMEYHSDEEIYGIARRVDREESGSKILYDIIFSWEGHWFLSSENKKLEVVGDLVGYVAEKSTPLDRALRKSGLVGITADDIHLYEDDDNINAYKQRISRIEGYYAYTQDHSLIQGYFSNKQERFIPLYVPGQEKIIPIPPTIF